MTWINRRTIYVFKRPKTVVPQKRRLWVVLFLVLSFSVVLGSCTSERATGPIIELSASGTVVDSIDGSAIPLAMLTVGDSLTNDVAFSDSTGAYTVILNVIGTNILFCRKTGYATKVINVEITPQNTILDSVNFALMK